MSVPKKLRDKYESDYHTGRIAETFGGFEEAHWKDKHRWEETAKNISRYNLNFWYNSFPRILEIGCGEGSLLSELSKYNYNRGIYAGIDISQYALKHSVAPNLPLTLACASELPFKNNYFDAVLAFDVLEHLPYELAFHDAMMEIGRVLKPKGKLIVTIPLQNRDGTKNILKSNGILEHYIVQDEDWWKIELECYGFKLNMNGDSLKNKGYPYNMSPLNHFLDFERV
jgi:SAM-dependent methyltransferase